MNLHLFTNRKIELLKTFSAKINLSLIDIYDIAGFSERNNKFSKNEIKKNDKK